MKKYLRMKKLTQVTKDNWISTIDCLIASPKVHRYNVGLTVDVEQRQKQYKYFKPSWPHLLVIKSGLNMSMALKAEKFLFETLTSDKRSIAYKKYRNDARDGEHVPSTGGLSEGREYSIYVAWGTKESYECGNKC